MDPELKLRSDGLEWREVEGEVIVLDLEGSVYMSLNGSGAVCWHALAGGATRDEIVRRLTERFNVARERAERDVEDFLQELRSHDLLETGEDAPADPALDGDGGQ
jgi:Coenzyme PQQ synthesis protein D (PqqD)